MDFIPGQMNPADIGTRGIKMIKLENTGWLRGPSFLKLDNYEVALKASVF